VEYFRANCSVGQYYRIGIYLPEIFSAFPAMFFRLTSEYKLPPQSPAVHPIRPLDIRREIGEFQIMVKSIVFKSWHWRHPVSGNASVREKLSKKTLFCKWILWLQFWNPLCSAKFSV